MRLILFTTVVFLFLSLTFVQEIEANPAFFAIFVRLGYKLVKRSWYAKCNTRNVPAGMNCPGVVFGVGLSKNMAINAARLYANQVGDSGCGRYVGHCQVKKFIKSG